MITLLDLIGDTMRRLGDVEGAIWSADEVAEAIRRGYQILATEQHVFYDWTYLENLPPWFSQTQPWEAPYLAAIAGVVLGTANFTYEDERAIVADERTLLGPACYTNTWELLEGYLARSGASTDIPATAQLPKTLTAIARVTYDGRAITPMEARRLVQTDSRFQITKGEVYGYLWELDGVRTLRKVRVPSMIATTHVITGQWGVARGLTDVSTSPVTGTWGVCRRLPGHHPIGPTFWGTIRHVYEEGKNVRVEHWRQGRAMRASDDACELPDRYALYLRDYAMWQALGRNGPGCDLKLAGHFKDRWTRDLARLARRLDMVDRTRVSILGGDDVPITARPPRPRLPWNYGSVVR